MSEIISLGIHFYKGHLLKTTGIGRNLPAEYGIPSEHSEFIMMKKSGEKVIICYRASSGIAGTSLGITLSLNPFASSLNVSEPSDLDIIISEPGDGVRVHSFRELAEFRFDIRYETAVPDFSICTGRKELPCSDSLNFPEHSHIWKLGFRSSDRLPVAEVFFIGSGPGSLSFLNKRQAGVFGDSPGNIFSAGSGNNGVAGKSEAAAMLLLGSGLIGVAGFRKKLRKIREVSLPATPGRYEPQINADERR